MLHNNEGGAMLTTNDIELLEWEVTRAEESANGNPKPTVTIAAKDLRSLINEVQTARYTLEDIRKLSKGHADIIKRRVSATYYSDCTVPPYSFSEGGADE